LTCVTDADRAHLRMDVTRFSRGSRQTDEAENVRVNGEMVLQCADGGRQAPRLGVGEMSRWWVTGRKHYLADRSQPTDGRRAENDVRENRAAGCRENFYYEQEEPVQARGNMGFAEVNAAYGGSAMHRQCDEHGPGHTWAILATIARNHSQSVTVPGFAAQWDREG